jgi:hypothetical protein
MYCQKFAVNNKLKGAMAAADGVGAVWRLSNLPGQNKENPKSSTQ